MMSTIIERPSNPWGNVIPLGYKFYPGPLFRRRFVSELWSKAKAIPTLDLRFADSKSLTDAVSGQNLIDFTRASGGTYVGSDGLIKNSVVNLLLRSEEFDNDFWPKSRCSCIPNATLAPNNTFTADAIVEDTSNSSHILQADGNTNPVSGTTYTYSWYLKAGERTALRIQFGTDNAVWQDETVHIDLSNGTLSNVSGFTNTPVVENVGNGWYRLSATVTAQASANGVIRMTPLVGGTIFYAGDGASKYFIWGAQLEQSSTVGEYVKTTSSISGAPRFDHDPETGESLGLLVEEQRTNLLLRSEEFDNASWSKLNGVTVSANATIAPDGTITADKIIEPASTAGKPIAQSVTIAADTTHAASIYFKAAERPTLLFHVRKSDYSTRFGGFFNTSTGVVTAESASGGVLSSYSFTPVGNGWYRCSITGSIGANTAAVVTAYIANSSNQLGYTGDGTSGIYLWGAQLEAGSFPTSYIPTTSAQVTRNADVASITGDNFSRWYSQSQGTVFADFIPQNTSISGAFGFDDTTNSERWRIGHNGSSAATLTVLDGNTVQASLNTGPASVLLGSSARCAAALKANDFQICANGQYFGVADTLGTMPTVTQATIGTAQASNSINGPISRLTYFDRRLPNATLQAITKP